MNIRKQRVFSLLFLLLILAIFLLPVVFAGLLLQNMRKLCTTAFESEAAMIAEQISDLSIEEIDKWYHQNKRSGAIYIWQKNASVPTRYGKDYDIWLLAKRPTEEKTELHGGSVWNRHIVSTTKKLPDGMIIALCKSEKQVYGRIRHALVLLIGFSLLVLPGLLLTFYRFAVYCSKTTALAIYKIITDTPEVIPDTGDQKTDDKLHELALDFHAINKRSEHERLINMEKVASLAAGMAHDFGNLLTVFRGNLELAEMMSPLGPVKSNLQECKTALDATVKLNNQFLSFAKGGVPITAPVAPEEFFKRQTAFILRSRKTTAEFTCSKDLPDAIMDAAQIYHVLNNILINASHAMKEEGVIHIDLTSVMIPRKKQLKLNPGLYLRVRISDTGPGIPPEDREKIFYPFYTTRHNGNGLGLPMCLVTMQRHNGLIMAIEPPSGHGACIELYLPAVPPQQKTEPTANQPEEVEYKYRGGGKILILDDQPSICQLLCKILEIMNCQCECASNEKECIEKYRQAERDGAPFDLLFMDLTLPGESGGAAILQKLREEFPNVRAIAASGYSDDEILAEYKKYGFSDKLLKPFRLKDVNRLMWSLFPDRH